MRLISAIGTIALALIACGGSAEAPSAEPSEGAPTPSQGGSAAPPPADLEAMLAPVPEYEGTGRNLFVFGPARRAGGGADPAAPVQPPPPQPPPPRPPQRPPLPAAARLDVKYAGFLQKTGPDGAKAKYAIFLDGNEILAGAEGELVANQFTVVEIGLESVTVSAGGSKATQRIPLQSN